MFPPETGKKTNFATTPAEKKNIIAAAINQYAVGRLPAFGWLAAGATLTLYAQLLDEKSLWLVLQGENHTYAARRFAEEALELAAYWLLLAGLLELYLTAPREAPESTEGTTS